MVKLTVKEASAVDQIKIGRFIASLRKEQGMTQEQLAERLGVTQKSVSRWETGKNMPDLSLLKPLSAQLNISVSELLDGEKSQKAEEISDEAIDRIIDYSIKSKRKSLLSYGEARFTASVIAVLAAILLAAGAVINAQTIPAMVCVLVITAAAVWIFCGRCPKCGKTLPITLKYSRSCPFCGAKLE